MLTRDLKLLESIFEVFFYDKKIQSYMKFFHECGVHDFEKWAQIELGYFLENYDDEKFEISEWKREVEVDLHKGMARHLKANKMSIDFLIKPYRAKGKNSYVFLELKQNRSVKTCISKMFDDLDKMDMGKGKEARDSRGLWVAGIFEKGKARNIEEVVSSIISSEANKRGWDISQDLIVTRSIPEAHFAYTIF